MLLRLTIVEWTEGDYLPDEKFVGGRDGKDAKDVRRES